MDNMISVIIPAYNVEKYIEETLEAILQQTYKNLQVIIIDDGSTDNTYKILELYQGKYPDTFFVYKQINGGQSDARNNALKYVKGEYLTFIDADDLIEKDYFEVLLKAAQMNDSDISMCAYRTFNTDTKEFLDTRNPKDWEVFFDKENKHVFHYSPCGKLFRTAFIKKYDFKFSVGEQLEDGPYSVMSDLLANHVEVLSYGGYLYRMRSDSTTGVLHGKYKKPKVPYRGIEEAILKVQKYNNIKEKNNILEFAIIKILTGLLTNMYKNIDSQTRKEICEYSYKTIKTYFPEAKNNPYIGLFKVKKLPFIHRAAISLFMVSYRMKCLYPFSIIVSKVL